MGISQDVELIPLSVFWTPAGQGAQSPPQHGKAPGLQEKKVRSLPNNSLSHRDWKQILETIKYE